MNAKTVSFTLALNSSPADVAEVVDSIHDFFGINDSGTVAPQSIAPVVTAPVVTAPVVTAGDHDVTGLPWDERIHASTKAKSADGSWRARRGVDAGLKAGIEAQLRSTVAAPQVPPQTPQMPAMPQMPVASAPAENPLFTNFVKYIVDRTQAGRLTDDWVKSALTNYGVADGSLQNLAHRLDLIPVIEAGIRQALGE